MDICFDVVHALPGRMRIRIPQIRRDRALADAVAESLLSRPGVTCVRVNAACASVVVDYDTARLHTFIPEKHLRGLRFEQKEGRVSVSANGHKTGRVRDLLRRLANLILPTAALGLSLAGRLVPIGPLYGLVAAAAAPIFHRAALMVWRERRIGVDFLDATAVTVMGLQRNLSTCAFMAWLISLGEHIREETARKSRKAIADLLHFNSGTATVVRAGIRIRVPVESLARGDLVAVCPGDAIPVDGVITGGRAAVDQRSLTGESAMLELGSGDRVFAGSVAVDGELLILAEAVGTSTRAGRIVEMLRSAPAQDTRIEDHAARFADRLVLPTFAASGAVFAATRNVARALSMLIVDFGTGVRVAAPTAFLSFMAYAAQHNIVIRGGRALEKLASADAVIFDKTGTLTTGTPAVRRVIPIAGRASPRRIISLAASAEAGLNHPIANALAARAAEMDAPALLRDETRLRVGLGVAARIDRTSVLIGSARFMAEEGVDISEALVFEDTWTLEAASPLFVAGAGTILGVITYSDSARPESEAVIRGLRRQGMDEIAVLTGDREEITRATCEQLGISRWVSGAFPEQKLEILREMQRSGRTVAVVGDGVNDSLALAHADVAIAPACATDAAKEASDVLLMEDDLRLLVEAFHIARSAVRLVRQNYRIVALPNAAALVLAAGGLLGPPGATLINNGSTVAAGLNGLRPLAARANGGNGHNGNGGNGNGRAPVCRSSDAGYSSLAVSEPGAQGTATNSPGQRSRRHWNGTDGGSI